MQRACVCVCVCVFRVSDINLAKPETETHLVEFALWRGKHARLARLRPLIEGSHMKQLVAKLLSCMMSSVPQTNMTTGKLFQASSILFAAWQQISEMFCGWTKSLMIFRPFWLNLMKFCRKLEASSSVHKTSSPGSTFKNQLLSTSAQSSSCYKCTTQYCQRDCLITHHSLASLMQIHLTFVACDWRLRTFGLHFLFGYQSE